MSTNQYDRRLIDIPPHEQLDIFMTAFFDGMITGGLKEAKERIRPLLITLWNQHRDLLTNRDKNFAALIAKVKVRRKLRRKVRKGGRAVK